MLRTALTAPSLTVTTRPLDRDEPLLDFADREAPLAFLRDGEGIVGVGEAVRHESLGKTRMQEASAFWRALAARAVVTDDVRLPGTGLVGFGAFAFADDSAAASALVVPRHVIGRRGGVTWITTIEDADGSSGDEPTPTPIAGHVSTTFGSGHIDEDAYAAAVGQAVARIRAGEAQKIVLARDRVAELPEDADLRAVLRDLGEAYPQCVAFAIDGVIGATPETLARTEHGTFAARVLAGSAARGHDPESDRAAADALAASQKDVEEHAFAARSIVASLERIADDVHADGRPRLLQLPNLWHLASHVQATLPTGMTSLDVADALHPTAAVAGTPTDVALRAIREIEGADRGRYAGPVGWIGADGDGEWMLALRSAEVGDGTVRAWAGAGIVAASAPEREVEETTLKLRPITEAMA